jgi:hypothetical protein
MFGVGIGSVSSFFYMLDPQLLIKKNKKIPTDPQPLSVELIEF